MKIPRLLRLTAGLLCTLWAASFPASAQIDQTILDGIKTMTFQHNGTVNSLQELHFIKQQIAAGVEPWASNYQKMATSSLASLTYTPHPVAHVDPDGGGTDQLSDALAAYTQALMWIFTGDERYAQKSIEIQNAWSYTLVDITNSNWYLQASWVGAVSAMGAELIRDTYPAWSSADIAQYKSMLNNCFLPILNKRYSFGNREFSVCSALVAIGIFNDDRAAFYQGIQHWMSYLPCYIYMPEDGASPLKADYFLTEPTLDEYYAMHADLFANPADSWVYRPNTVTGRGDDKTLMTKATVDEQWKMSVPNYFQGCTAETVGRDIGHVEGSICSVFQVAEMARNQGIDLYSGRQYRLAAFLEANASIRLGNPLPKGDYVLNSGNGVTVTYENGYNRLANVMGMSLPYTRQLIIPTIRSAQNHYTTPPAGIFATRLWNQAFYTSHWETLTHAELGDGTNLSLRGIFSGTPGYASASQKPAVAQDTSYVAKLWIKGTGAVRLLIRSSGSGATLLSQRIDAPATWTLVTTAPFNTGSNSQLTVQLIDSYNVPGTVHVDDCFVGVDGGVNLLANSGFQGRNAQWTGSNGSVWTVGQYAVSSVAWEAENVETVSASKSVTTFYETTASNGAAEKLSATEAGDYLTYTLPGVPAGTYQVLVRVKKYSSRGQCQLDIDGVNQGGVQDQYGAATAYETWDLGNRTFAAAGDKIFRFTVTGKNAASPGYSLAFDYILLVP